MSSSYRTESLDAPLDAFERQLRTCVDLVIKRYANLYEANAHAEVSPETVRAWFDEPLPQNGVDVERVLAEVETKVMAHSVMNPGTKMFAYVMSGGTQASVMADLLASALDQNVAKWHLSPSMTEIERRVIRWTADFIGLEQHHAGAIVASGSAANLTGLTVARNLFAESFKVREKGLFNMKPLIVYASNQTHTSVEKAIELLGIGSDNYRKIGVTHEFTIDLDALTAAIDADRAAGLQPFCVVGNAGTVNTGAIDPLRALGDIAAQNGLWFHVDGAYGGLAASLADKRELYDGLNEAGSIALDYHKWLYQPYEVGCTLVRDWQSLQRTYHKSAEYLEFGVDEARFDISRHHFDLSRNAKAFKVWMSFKAYGARRLQEMIAKDIRLNRYLATRVAASEDFELIDAGPLGISCFRYTAISSSAEAAIDAANSDLLDRLESDGRVFVTGTVLHGRQVLRPCVINHRLKESDIDYLLDVIRQVARSGSAR